MATFLEALHVLAAVLLIGPLVLVPFAGRRAIRRRDPDAARAAANQVILFGAGSVLVAGLGVATVLADEEWTLATPWVLISLTLYVVALALVALYAVPALRRAAHLVAATAAAGSGPGAGPDLGGNGDSGGPGGSPSTDPSTDPSTEPPAEPPAGPSPDGSAADPRDQQRLQAISARVAGAGWLLLVTFAAITILMTTRPFE